MSLIRQYDVTPVLAKSWTCLTLKERHRHATYKIGGHNGKSTVRWTGRPQKAIEVSVLNVVTCRLADPCYKTEAALDFFPRTYYLDNDQVV